MQLRVIDMNHRRKCIVLWFLFSVTPFIAANDALVGQWNVTLLLSIHVPDLEKPNHNIVNVNDNSGIAEVSLGHGSTGFLSNWPMHSSRETVITWEHDKSLPKIEIQTNVASYTVMYHELGEESLVTMVEYHINTEAKLRSIELWTRNRKPSIGPESKRVNVSGKWHVNTLFEVKPPKRGTETHLITPYSHLSTSRKRAFRESVYELYQTGEGRHKFADQPSSRFYPLSWSYDASTTTTHMKIGPSAVRMTSARIAANEMIVAKETKIGRWWILGKVEHWRLWSTDLL